jgi:hypothetical protein
MQGFKTFYTAKELAERENAARLQTQEAIAAVFSGTDIHKRILALPIAALRAAAAKETEK